jgi:hypothetical protein
LELAVDKKFRESLDKMNDTVTAVEAQVGPHSKFHLFLYQRMASLHMLLSELDGVEHMFKKSIDVAE